MRTPLPADVALVTCGRSVPRANRQAETVLSALMGGYGRSQRGLSPP